MQKYFANFEMVSIKKNHNIFLTYEYMYKVYTVYVEILLCIFPIEPTFFLSKSIISGFYCFKDLYIKQINFIHIKNA